MANVCIDMYMLTQDWPVSTHMQAQDAPRCRTADITMFSHPLHPACLVFATSADKSSTSTAAGGSVMRCMQAPTLRSWCKSWMYLYIPTRYQNTAVGLGAGTAGRLAAALCAPAYHSVHL
eukprot:GHRR01013421.1.p2 GENE.GHRR01013421.1~~GHRR01013421.1.p2  ORF type:complete len:120 (+),score=34.66 GHRR01013421.1:1362-1721(+)